MSLYNKCAAHLSPSFRVMERDSCGAPCPALPDTCVPRSCCFDEARWWCRTRCQRWLEGSTLRLLLLMHHPTLLLVLYAFALFRIAGACSSRSTPRPRPPPQPTMRPNITFQTYACPEAYAKWYCLNGATCFSVKIGESILYNCECADGFVGQRCEFKDLEGSYLASRQQIMIETASLAGGVTLVVLVIVIVSVAIYVHYKKKRKEQTHAVAARSRVYRPFAAFRHTEQIVEPRKITAKDPETGRRHESDHEMVGTLVGSEDGRTRTSL